MVGFLGLGNMGAPMALNLVRAGTPVAAWTRSQGKASEFIDAGGRLLDTPDQVFAESRIVIVILANGDAIDHVTGRGSDRFSSNVAGRIVVHMGTTSPLYSLSLAEDVAANSGQYVEAPVSGSRGPAEAGQLVCMLAGDAASVEEVRPVLEPMLLKSVDCGAVPGALRMKLAVNLFLITQVVGLAEAFQFAEGHGLSLETFQQVLDSGPMASAVSRMKLDKLVRGDFDVQASVRDVHYNSALVSGAARERTLASPLIDACDSLFDRAEALGFGDADMAAVVRALEDRTQALSERN